MHNTKHAMEMLGAWEVISPGILPNLSISVKVTPTYQ